MSRIRIPPEPEKVAQIVFENDHALCWVGDHPIAAWTEIIHYQLHPYETKPLFQSYCKPVEIRGLTVCFVYEKDQAQTGISFVMCPGLRAQWYATRCRVKHILGQLFANFCVLLEIWGILDIDHELSHSAGKVRLRKRDPK